MSEQLTKNLSPGVLLLVSTHCVHCKTVLTSLADMVKDGAIASLEVINLEQRPEMAEKLGVRSVPWVRIGMFELEGRRSGAELENWVKLSGTRDGIVLYLTEVLSQGQVQRALALIDKNEDVMPVILDLLSDADAKINLRLGIGVIMEEHASSEMFRKHIPRLVKFTEHEDQRVRSDACHYLSLTHDPTTIPVIEKLLTDSNDEVREVAQESIELLREYA